MRASSPTQDQRPYARQAQDAPDTATHYRRMRHRRRRWTDASRIWAERRRRRRRGHAGGQVEQHGGVEALPRRRRARSPVRNGRWRCPRRRPRSRRVRAASGQRGRRSRAWALEAGVRGGVLRPCGTPPRRGRCPGRGGTRRRPCRRRSAGARSRRSRARSPKCAPGSMWKSLVATTWSQRSGDAASSGGDAARHAGAAGDGERPALAEVVLHVDDDQCTAHGRETSSPVRR